MPEPGERSVEFEEVGATTERAVPGEPR